MAQEERARLQQVAHLFHRPLILRVMIPLTMCLRHVLDPLVEGVEDDLDDFLVSIERLHQVVILESGQAVHDLLLPMDVRLLGTLADGVPEYEEQATR